MEDYDPFEQGTHNFSGVVKTWTAHSAELVTDSGLVLFLATQGQPQVPVGSRISVTARKLRPRFQVMSVSLL